MRLTENKCSSGGNFLRTTCGLFVSRDELGDLIKKREVEIKAENPSVYLLSYLKSKEVSTQGTLSQLMQRMNGLTMTQYIQKMEAENDNSR